ncbi:hypothetical protein FEM08_15520 [Flavobacterium gilvum]|nr:hypothetical protein FEM08_15520 [Flavobacterium gilvum]
MSVIIVFVCFFVFCLISYLISGTNVMKLCFFAIKNAT